jgi:hypothetical protein
MTNTPDGIWKDWTLEDWLNAEYCEDCGLPLIAVEAEKGDNFGVMICVYCTWVEDDKIIARQERRCEN